MCGIIGYLGSKNAVNYLINGLQKLEYRGYDSCGISLKQEKIKTIKSVGKVKNLSSLISKDDYASIGIGHTRWATHGIPSINNCHPHNSYNNQFVLVHNGTIDNYQTLKDKYLKDINLYSSTDTEILVNLIAKVYDGDVLKTLKNIQKLLIGSYSIVLLNKDENKLYFVKNQTPLVFAHLNHEYFLASDCLAFPSFINKHIILDDGDFGYISHNGFEIFNQDGSIKKLQYKEVLFEETLIDNSLFSHHMEKEIYDQPIMIEKIISYYFNDNGINISKNIFDNIANSNHIYLVGCGSSYYSANMGKYYIEKHLKKEVSIILASEALYQLPIIAENAYFIFISQSGETLDVINLLKIVKTKNIKTLAITNCVNSSITNLCDDTLFIQADREISVASTKAFLGQSLILFLLTKQLKTEQLYSLKNEINNVLKNIEKIKEISKKLVNFKDVFYLGRNIDYYIALEASLKLKEISYIHAEAFPAGELKHGTLALIDENTAVIAVISQDNISHIMRTNIAETSARKAYTIVISTDNVSSPTDNIILKSVDNDLSPLLILIVTQLIAYYTALYKGNDIDTPRNLAKSVTVE